MDIQEAEEAAFRGFTHPKEGAHSAQNSGPTIRLPEAGSAGSAGPTNQLSAGGGRPAGGRRRLPNKASVQVQLPEAPCRRVSAFAA